MKRLGRPLMLLHTLAMLMMLPAPWPPWFCSMRGSAAWIAQNCARTFRFSAKFHSSSVACSTVPLCTNPAQLNRMSIAGIAPITCARACVSSRLYRQIAEQLRGLIAAGEFASGTRLPAERDLARELGVSRPSVREALIALEIEGWVEVRTGSGIYVQPAQQRAGPGAQRNG